jgi:hypothetical protein
MWLIYPRQDQYNHSTHAHTNTLVTYFPLIRHGRHRKRFLYKFCLAAGMCSLSRWLTTIGDIQADPQTLLWYDMDCTDNYASKNSSIIAYICCRGKVHTAPLNISESGYTQSSGRASWSSRWDGLSCHDIHTQFRHSKVDGGNMHTDTQIARWSHKRNFIFLKRRKVCL